MGLLQTSIRIGQISRLHAWLPPARALPGKPHDRHQTGEAYGLPPYEPPSCGTAHLLAERTLRMAEAMMASANRFDFETLTSLVDDAGVHFAREWLVSNAHKQDLDCEIPF